MDKINTKVIHYPKPDNSITNDQFQPLVKLLASTFSQTPKWFSFQWVRIMAVCLTLQKAL
jgi:hypothetical protein